MLKLKTKAHAKTAEKDCRAFLDRCLEKRKKGLFFEPDAKTFRWIAPRER